MPARAPPRVGNCKNCCERCEAMPRLSKQKTPGKAVVSVRSTPEPLSIRHNLLETVVSC